MIAALLGWLQGRGRRLEYWIMVVAIVAAVVLAHLSGAAAPLWALRSASFILWCPIAVRRLRDAGLPLWLAPFPLAIPLLVAGVQRLLPASGLPGAGGPAQSLGLASLALVLCLVMLLGVWPPKPPPPPGAERQAEVFG